MAGGLLPAGLLLAACSWRPAPGGLLPVACAGRLIGPRSLVFLASSYITPSPTNRGPRRCPRGAVHAVPCSPMPPPTSTRPTLGAVGSDLPRGHKFRVVFHCNHTKSVPILFHFASVHFKGFLMQPHSNLVLALSTDYLSLYLGSSYTLLKTESSLV